MKITVNDVDLCVETSGDPTDPPVLLIGITCATWPDELCDTLDGRYIVRYDLRDAGRSTLVDPQAPDHDLRDLVSDASTLIAALQVGPTHVVGLGVAGFIAQLLALDHREQVASLTLVGTRPVAPGPTDPDLPEHQPETMAQLFGLPEPDWTDRDSVINHATESARVLSGSVDFDADDIGSQAGAIFDRTRPTVAAQQASHSGIMFAAIDCQPRWRERLGEIAVPTLVVHGQEDPFFPHGNGVALAEEIDGAELLTLPGIGPGLPRVVWPTFVDALLRHTGSPHAGLPHTGLPHTGWPHPGSPHTG